MAAVPLDSRQARITRHLLAHATPATIEAIASDLKLTARVVRYNLPSVETYLRAAGLDIVRRPGVGIWVSGDGERRRRTLSDLEPVDAIRVLSADERQLRGLAALLDAAPHPIDLGDLEGELGVSRPTVRRDVRATEPWLDEHHLHLQRLPGTGVAIRGRESDIRRALLSLVLESTETDALVAAMRAHRSGPTGPLAALIAELDLPTFRRILREQLDDRDDNAPMAIAETLFIAIVARRVRRGYLSQFQGGQLRSLIDHPVAEVASRIASAVGNAASLSLTDADVASITEFMLGFVELIDENRTPEPDDNEVIERLVGLAAARLHAALGEDELLRRNLTDHLRRLRVRLRYGLPIANPLDHEVRARYPDVHAVATEIVAALGPLGESAVPPEEVGFLTMYLAGSLERHRLRPKIRVTVVCPAGMATAWILVSRLAAEFPNVEVTRVVSKSAFEQRLDAENADVVVSTVPLGDAFAVQSVVVSPLLHERDVRRLARIFGEPATH